MSQAGDKHERGASVSRITDASRRRKPHGAAPAPPPSAPDAGTGLLSSMDLEPEGELGTAAPADDVLDQLITRRVEPSARQSGTVLDAEPPPSAGLELDDVQQQIDHLHERAQHTRTRSAARGSADLGPALPQGSHRRHSSTESSTEATGAGGRRAKRTLLIAAVGVVIALIGVTVGSLASDKTATTPVLARDQHPVVGDAAGIEHALSAVTASIAAQLREAESAAALVAKRAKARAKARARARAAARPGDVAARRRRRAPAQTTGTARPAPTAASSTGSEPTYSTSPPQTSYRAPSSDPRSASGGSSGSTSLPAGPTGIGSAGRNCNPKCS